MIVIGADHGGFELKEVLKDYLIENGHEVSDCGVYDSQSADYPDIASCVGNKVAGEKAAFGILVCGTGIGISIAANKIKGVRAALLRDVYSAQMAKEHNDANIVCFGGRVTPPGEAVAMLKAFMDAGFQGGRHQTRVDKIMGLEE